MVHLEGLGQGRWLGGREGIYRGDNGRLSGRAVYPPTGWLDGIYDMWLRPGFESVEGVCVPLEKPRGSGRVAASAARPYCCVDEWLAVPVSR